MKKVKLDAIAEALEWVDDETSVYYIGLRNEWFEFRDNCFRSRAEDWCKDHGLEWE